MNSSLPNLKKDFLIVFFLFFSITFYSQTENLNLINTNPQGAEILNDQNLVLGITPFDFKKLEKQTLKIKIVKANYDTIHITLKEKKKDTETFLNAITECNTCLIDTEKGTEKNVLKLLKSFKETDNIILVGIENPILKINEDDLLGKLNGSKKYLKDKDIYHLLGYPENMEMKILNSFKNSYIDANYFSRKDSEKKEVSNLQSPKNNL